MYNFNNGKGLFFKKGTFPFSRLILIFQIQFTNIIIKKKKKKKNYQRSNTIYFIYSKLH